MLTDQPVALGAPLAPMHNPFAELGGVAAPDDAYVFDLPSTFDELSLRYRAETRRIDRSKMRKLEVAGAVTFRFAETPEERVAMTADILDRKAAQLAVQGIVSIFAELGSTATLIWRWRHCLPNGNCSTSPNCGSTVRFSPAASAIAARAGRR